MDKNTKDSFFRSIWHGYIRLASMTGFYALMLLKKLYDGEDSLSKTLAARLDAPLNRLCRKVSAAVMKAVSAVTGPFRAFGRGAKLVVRNMSDAAKLGPGFVFRSFFHTVFDGLRRNRHMLKTMLNYLAAAAGITVFIVTVHLVSSVDCMLEVRHNGELLGYIEDENVYENAEKMFQQRIVYGNNETPFELKPELSLQMMSSGKTMKENQLVNRMIQLCTDDVVEAEGVYIDGVFYGAVPDSSEIRDVLDAALERYRTGKKGETVTFVKPIELVDGLYLTQSLVEQQEILELLNSEVAGETTYIVQAGDTPSGVAKKNGVPYAEFKAMNPDCETNFLIGQKVYLSKSEPFLAVKVIRRETRKQEIMYQTETIKDSTKDTTYKKVTQKGAKGVTEYTEDVEYINGVETGRTTVSAKVLQNVINEKIVQGTKISGSSNLTAGGAALKGLNFIWPLNGGRLNSRYGMRWGRMHYGVDILAPYGTSTYAAEDGVVILSRWYSGFGNCVIIDNGNGVNTLYGHASKLLVKVGQKVKKGEVISLVGSTGNSFGNHCHFEVRVNGKRIDPLPYISH